jgi:hypothetical protein
MINSIGGASQVAQSYQAPTNTQVHKNVQGDKQPPDSVVLSKQAGGTGDVDHDGDSH